jgi:hypothetical protein
MWQVTAAVHVKWLTRAARKVAVKGRNVDGARAHVAASGLLVA